jgi:hypothetical protein
MSQMKQMVTGCGLLLMSAIVAGMVLFSLFVALIATTFGTGHGAGAAGSCSTSATTAAPVTVTVSLTPQATPKSGGGGCVPASGIAAAVVHLAEQMANALYVNPACHGTISYPNCYYTWYNNTFPPSVIQYGEQVCPGCAAWADGTYQCVSFVRGAYSQSYPMQWTANAFDLWATYQGKPGWVEIPSAEAPPGQRGMPLPGDAIIFKDASIGHTAIVMNVVPPNGGQNGSIAFANANSVSPYTTMPLLPDLTVDTSSWPGYTVWGYIRPAGKGQ